MGYTNIARGISRMMGFELAINFKLPYFARNPSEFWRRWHISLSTWLRDFLYIRLGGNRGSPGRTSANMMITMVLGGLWHGAAWNFVLWGAYHGLLLAIFRRFAGRATLEPQSGPGHWLRVLGYFHLTCFGWLLFRAEGFDDFTHKLKSIVLFTDLQAFWSPDFGLVLACAAPLFLFEYYQYRKDDLEPWLGWNAAGRIFWTVALLSALAIYKAPFQSPFIYFQF
jgi:D-alanyl-lipoteichoic acid acyltransferase DltB (MBOAT superfamily)